MRNNSLRYQLASHNRQQSRLFKKMGRLNTHQHSSQVTIHASINPPDIQQSGDQHSDIKWLEKMVGDLRNYKTAQREDKSSKNLVNHSISYGMKPLGILEEKSLERNKIGEVKEPIKAEFLIQDNKRSGKKIKFEIVSNKENKVTTKKNSNLIVSGRNIDKNKSKNKKMSQNPGIQSKQKDKIEQNKVKKQLGLNDQTKNVQIDKMVTDPCFIERSKGIQQDINSRLWQSQQKIQYSFLRRSYDDSKKSVGKIVRNNRNEQTNFKSLSSTCIQKPKAQLPLTEKKVDKVYIKLQTQKLQKYLVESNAKESELEQKILQTEEYKKYCPTKRGDHLCIKLIPNDKKVEMLCDKTKVIERKKNVETNMKTEITSACNQEREEPLKQMSKYDIYKKEKGKLLGINSCSINKNRSKSQQRKFNKCLRLSNTKQVQKQQQIQQIDHVPSFNSNNLRQQQQCQIYLPEDNANKIIEFKISNKLNQNILLSNQRLFTLHSDPQMNQGQIIQKLQPFADYTNEQECSLDIAERSQKYIFQKKIASIKPLQIQQLVYSSIDQLQEPIKVESTQLNKLDLSIPQTQGSEPILTFKQPSLIRKQSNTSKQGKNEQKQSFLPVCQPNASLNKHNLQSNQLTYEDNYICQLTLLFNFLDQSKKGTLTSSNCKFDGLTQDLKLLFSSILNQIKSKKATYNLNKFLTEGQSVLKIKQELYTSHRSSLFKCQTVFQILKQNLQLLKKKSPLEFIKHTHTHSYFQTNQNTKRDSQKDNHSIVLSKHLVNEQKGRFQTNPLKVQFSIDDEKKEIDFEQPEIYLQKKYGIQTQKIQMQNLGKSNYYSSRTQGYLQNISHSFQI